MVTPFVPKLGFSALQLVCYTPAIQGLIFCSMIEDVIVVISMCIARGNLMRTPSHTYVHVNALVVVNYRLLLPAGHL